jgi:hypothetical protein
MRASQFVTEFFLGKSKKLDDVHIQERKKKKKKSKRTMYGYAPYGWFGIGNDSAEGDGGVEEGASINASK